MWYVHQKVSGAWSKGKAFVSEQYTSTGYQVADVDVVISVLVLIFVYAVVKACFFIYK
jgi:undecaprenyl-diphosphatase